MAKRFLPILIILLTFCFSSALLPNETAEKYFPSTLGNSWVYQDQDGNELTRTVIEGEEIAGKTYPAFSYNPELKDNVDYSWHIRSSLFNVSDAGITIIADDEIDKAIKARLKKEMDTLVEIAEAEEGGDSDFELGVEVEVKKQKHILFLPDAVTVNEEWDAHQMEVNVKLIPIEDGVPEDDPLIMNFTIIETGIITGTENVETPAGNYNDCLKVEFRTETTVSVKPDNAMSGLESPGETVTTLWLAPDVGIVKYQQELEYIFLKMMPEDSGFPMPPNPQPKTLELIRYIRNTNDAESGEKQSITTDEPLKNKIKTQKGTSPKTDDDISIYYPSTTGSYWVYEDQDGNELTRTVVQGEEIAGKTYPAFSYDPELKDKANYSPFIRPALYNISETGITLVVRDEVEEAIKAWFNKEGELVRKIVALDDPDDANFTFQIEAEAQDEILLLSTPITFNEEWDVNQIKAKFKLFNDEEEIISIDYSINVTGMILKKETVETTAGIFEDCLKIEYRTETTPTLNPPTPTDEVNPPGETVTTLWLAPNIGIVKAKVKSEYIFIKMIPDDEDFAILDDPKEKTIELKRYEVKTDKFENVEKQSINTEESSSDDSETQITTPVKTDDHTSIYFPSTVGSYWVYKDQDGNELTRTAVAGEEIDGKTYPAFSYTPELKDKAEYSPFISPALYNISETGITLVVKDEVEEAIKAWLSKEMDLLREVIALDDIDAADFTFKIEAEAQDNLQLLPTPITHNEEWDVNHTTADLTLFIEETEQPTMNYTIVETGIILGTENVETTAGIFENCLKVEYQTEATVDIKPTPPPNQINSPGETVTTVWYAPNVGIVKLQQQRKYLFFDMIPDDDSFPRPPDPEQKTLELTKYEIKDADK